MRGAPLEAVQELLGQGSVTKPPPTPPGQLPTPRPVHEAKIGANIQAPDRVVPMTPGYGDAIVPNPRPAPTPSGDTAGEGCDAQTGTDSPGSRKAEQSETAAHRKEALAASGDKDATSGLPMEQCGPARSCRLRLLISVIHFLRALHLGPAQGGI